jgi:hypothetical protein
LATPRIPSVPKSLREGVGAVMGAAFLRLLVMSRWPSCPLAQEAEVGERGPMSRVAGGEIRSGAANHES